jgi:glycosyltransferase involved in cell wall biosynthesis
MSNQMLEVTVCILSFNRAKYLRDAIESVFLQTHLPKEIIVFDNGSKSDVYKALDEYLKKGVRWEGADVTKTAAWNFRRAADYAKTKYVLILHDDDRLCSNFLEEQIKFLENNPVVVAVSCNGYLIDEEGMRNGHFLMPKHEKNTFEMYECSGDVALKYANDMCIPFSPVVYRSEILRLVDFREEYDKVRDAVFLCDIADISPIAYQSSPLYECRVHGEQDSSHFSLDVMFKLENFFWTRKVKNENDRSKLHKLLVVQHTSRNLRHFLNVLKGPKSIGFVCNEFKNVWDGVFSPVAAFKITIKLVAVRFSAIWKTNMEIHQNEIN